MQGVVNLLKPPGMTSHDAVAVLRRLFGVRRMGHAGTLDPGAAGVLPVAVGRATRLLQWLQAADKEYRAEMTLGVETDTLDAQGKTTAINTEFRIAPARLVDEMQMFLGHVMQVPPMVSSVKVRGERLYKAALRGEKVERKPRAVRIDALRIIRIWPEDALDLEFGARVLFHVACSKGTYIRSLCADIGRRLGCGAHLSFLVRTRTGPFVLEKSWTLEEVQQAVETGRIDDVLEPPERLVAHFPRLDLLSEQARRIVHGQAVLWDGELPERDMVRLHGPDGQLLAVARCTEGVGGLELQPVTVIAAPGEDTYGK